MLNPITAAAIAQARQDDIERRLRDPRWIALQEARRNRRRAHARGRRRHLSDVRRRLSTAFAPRAASRTA